MHWPTLLLIITCCVVRTVGNREVTLDQLLRQYCGSGSPDASLQQFRGPAGPKGKRGTTGDQGWVGPVGPVGRNAIINHTMVQKLFEESTMAVLRSVRWFVTSGIKLESCDDVKTKLSSVENVNSGIYEIILPSLGWTEVYCDLDQYQGGWTVFQRRFGGNEDFYRGWGDYVKGFGNKREEFWLGLEAIHRLTNTGDHEMRIDITAEDGTRFYAKYSSFKIGPATDNYRLHISGFSGNSTNPMSVQNQQQFSTKDVDNDLSSRNCGEYFGGGWWYYKCYTCCGASNLNGMYRRRQLRGVMWGNSYIRSSEMKFRRRH